MDCCLLLVFLIFIDNRVDTFVEKVHRDIVKQTYNKLYCFLALCNLGVLEQPDSKLEVRILSFG